MPIYEFRCRACGKKSTFLTRSVNQPLRPVCSYCDGSDMERLIGSFAYHKSMQTIHEESGEPTMNAGPEYYKDPRNIGRWTEKRFKEMGHEMPDSIKTMIQVAREGEMPGPVKDLQTSSPDAAYH
ncbi:MAG: hypothetical protein HYX87_07815 [Chloroflexi bacterium]|nr:hypothetical protein [Chloroflexota bacterium]